jgi:hypothetical protein
MAATESWAVGTISAGRCGLAIAPGLLHVAGMAKQALSPDSGTTEIQRGNRAMRHLNISGRLEHGALAVNFANGTTSCGSEIDHGWLSRFNLVPAGEIHQTDAAQLAEL